LEAIAARPTDAHPVPVLAWAYADKFGVEDTRHLRASMRRAVNRLSDEGAVTAADVLVPTRWLVDDERPYAWRWTLAVTAPGVEWNAELDSSAAVWMSIARPEVTEERETS
jgi:hypothetical protein